MRIEHENIPPQLSPIMARPALESFFKDKLPRGLSKRTLKGLSCEGYARLILSELGGPEKARILWYEIPDPDFEGDYLVAHAYVVPNEANPEDLAYNNEFSDEVKTVGFLRENGRDITDEALSTPWKRLSL